MTNTLEQRAEELSQRPYRVKLEKDEIADGEFVFLARVVEMPTCMAQGSTAVEAEGELREVMFEFIFSLLEDGEEVPEPRSPHAITTGGVEPETTIVGTVYGVGGFTDDLSDATRPKGRESLGELVWL